MPCPWCAGTGKHATLCHPIPPKTTQRQREQGLFVFPVILAGAGIQSPDYAPTRSWQQISGRRTAASDPVVSLQHNLHYTQQELWIPVATRMTGWGSRILTAARITLAMKRHRSVSNCSCSGSRIGVHPYANHRSGRRQRKFASNFRPSVLGPLDPKETCAGRSFLSEDESAWRFVPPLETNKERMLPGAGPGPLVNVMIPGCFHGEHREGPPDLVRIP